MPTNIAIRIILESVRRSVGAAVFERHNRLRSHASRHRSTGYVGCRVDDGGPRKVLSYTSGNFMQKYDNYQLLHNTIVQSTLREGLGINTYASYLP
jgi:hypothetical protein